MDNNLMDSSMQIFNMDETGMPLDPKPGKVITVCGVKHAMSITSGTKPR